MSLRESHSLKARQKKGLLITKGDVVILKDDVTKRQFCKLGVVTELLPERDGSIRAAMVRIAGDRKSMLRRSAKHLITIEIREDSYGH